MTARRALDWVPAGAMMALITWFSHQPDWPSAAKGTPDWLLHGLAFGVLALLTYWPTSDRLQRNWLRASLSALAITVTFAVFDELHQSTVPGRHAAVGDVIADLVGAAVALTALRWTPFARP